MLHIPGQYSGGETAEYRWTQTKAELEVRVPLPAGLADGSVTCEILPRSFAVRAGEEIDQLRGPDDASGARYNQTFLQVRLL